MQIEPSLQERRHSLGTQCQRCNEASAICHAAGYRKQNFQFVGCARQENHIRSIVFTRVSAALEIVHADGITADALCLQAYRTVLRL